MGVNSTPTTPTNWAASKEMAAGCGSEHTIGCVSNSVRSTSLLCVTSSANDANRPVWKNPQKLAKRLLRYFASATRIIGATSPAFSARPRKEKLRGVFVTSVDGHTRSAFTFARTNVSSVKCSVSGANGVIVNPSSLLKLNARSTLLPRSELPTDACGSTQQGASPTDGASSARKLLNVHAVTCEPAMKCSSTASTFDADISSPGRTTLWNASE